MNVKKTLIHRHSECFEGCNTKTVTQYINLLVKKQDIVDIQGIVEIFIVNHPYIIGLKHNNISIEILINKLVRALYLVFNKLIDALKKDNKLIRNPRCKGVNH